MYSSYQDAVGIDGVASKLEWTIFPGFASLSILEKFQEDLETRRVQPEDFTDRIIFMPMFSDIVWNAKDENCVSNAEKSRIAQRHS